MTPEVAEGTLPGGLPVFSLGAGPPLIVLRGLTPKNANPRGLSRASEVRIYASLARGRTVHAVIRRPGIAPGTTMADLAADHAQAIEAAFGGGPVDVVGVSTGGSVALQLTLDHPGVVRRLVLASSACRLGPLGREVQRRIGDELAAGRPRAASRAAAPQLSAYPLGQALAGVMLWLLAPVAMPDDPSDMIATIRAEDAFDVGPRLGEIRVPTLVIGGDRDRFYSPALFRETAQGVPHGHLRLYAGRGHGRTLTDRRLGPDVLAFVGEG